MQISPTCEVSATIHFTDGETETQKDDETFPKGHEDSSVPVPAPPPSSQLRCIPPRGPAVR